MTGNDGSSRIEGKHRLLPHERWFVSLVMKSRQAHQPSKSPRLDQNYGPEGISLIAAGFATAFPGQLAGCVGITLLIMFGSGGGSIVTVAFSLMGAGVLLGALGSVRYAQAGYAGRRFRGDRPFVRRF